MNKKTTDNAPIVLASQSTFRAQLLKNAGLQFSTAFSTIDERLVLGGLGALAARTGGAQPLRGALRVLFWGGLAMACTWAAGALFGAAG